MAGKDIYPYELHVETANASPQDRADMNHRSPLRNATPTGKNAGKDELAAMTQNPSGE